MSYPDFIKGLLKPKALDALTKTERITLKETHISWLLFTETFVFKIKKPVDFGFLDFSTLEKRRFYCQEELRLNTRLSPGVYLGVIEIKKRNGEFFLDGEGELIDFAVQMRRLPEERWLSHMLAKGEVTETHIRRIAERISQFHTEAEWNDEINRLGGLETVRQNVRENFVQTENQIGQTLTEETFDLIRAYTESFMEVKTTLFAQRSREKRIRDCHGDLHLGQICIENGIDFIDCIEFNQRFRFSDTAADIAFPLMDFDYVGRSDLGKILLDAYVAHSDDSGLGEILNFYKCYRAYVRGKVTGFLLNQLDEASEAEERQRVILKASKYFSLAKSYAEPKTPFLVIVSGWIGSGKSVLAETLAKRLNAEVLSSDIVRKKLSGVGLNEHHFEDWGKGIYSPEFTERTYKELHRCAAKILGRGKTVIIDATYAEKSQRETGKKVAEQSSALFLLIQTSCPEKLIEQRLRHREKEGKSPSDGRIDILQTHIAHYQPIKELRPMEYTRVDTALSQRESAFSALKAIFAVAIEHSSYFKP